jgi:hypothetical protein
MGAASAQSCTINSASSTTDPHQGTIDVKIRVDASSASPLTLHSITWFDANGNVVGTSSCEGTYSNSGTHTLTFTGVPLSASKCRINHSNGVSNTRTING